MSLQIGFGNSNYISQYAGYNTGASGSLATPSIGNGISGEQAPAAVNMQNDKLMKKIGAVECQTCQSRKYVDGSNDAGVSFKTPTHVSPESSGAAVMSHEQEHVSREGAKARSEGRKIVAQSVQIYTDVCTECGRAYTSGGKTTTISKSENNKTDYFMDNMRKSMGNHFGKYFDEKV
jgi:hypothetical protein